MAFSKVDEKYVSFADGGTANGSTGHDVVGVNGTTAAAGDVDTLFVGSDTTVTTPTGFTLVQTFVGNQGGYHYERVCTGGESATIRVKTTGDFNTTALFQRWRGCGARDVAVNSHVDSNGALSSNAINSGTLAASTELVIVASVMTDSVSAAPTLNTWSAGYTPGDGASSIGTGATCSAGFISHKNPAGTAAETPSVSWTPDNMRNRYTFLVSYQLGAGNVSIQDSSGGASAGSSAETVQSSIVKQDSSSGASAGASAEQLQVGVVKQDSSAGASGGGSPDTVQSSIVLQDGSGGASGGGASESPTVDKIIQNGSGGASGGGANEQPTNATILQDTSSGASAGSSAETLLISTVIQDSSGGAAGGSSRETVSAGGPADITINDTSGGAAAGSSRETIQTNTGVVHDKMVMPVLLVAEACLTTEAGKLAKPPAEYQIRPGASFVAYADQTRDECCNGIGWIRPGQMWETDDFPVQRTGASKIEPADYAVVIEIGIIRCLPTQSDQPGLQGQGAKPTNAQWLQATQEAMDDAAALRRVVCCLRELYHIDAVVAGQINPLQNEANCSGTTITVTMRVPACDCFDTG
jgi:hypothetical protein